MRGDLAWQLQCGLGSQNLWVYFLVLVTVPREVFSSSGQEGKHLAANILEEKS
jgi:hypothetical protein